MYPSLELRNSLLCNCTCILFCFQALVYNHEGQARIEAGPQRVCFQLQNTVWGRPIMRGTIGGNHSILQLKTQFQGPDFVPDFVIFFFQIFLWRERYQRLISYVANQNEYLRIVYNNGQIDHQQGWVRGMLDYRPQTIDILIRFSADSRYQICIFRVR